MARINWHGTEFTATPVRQDADGSWLMTAIDKHPRFAPGTTIRVQPSEVIEMAAAEIPAEDSA